jgi:hypothetical protein
VDLPGASRRGEVRRRRREESIRSIPSPLSPPRGGLILPLLRSADDARHLLDRMPPSRKKRKSVPPVTATDHMSALPDHMLHHLLSFLPVQAAVQTCVLARRWRHLWKSTTGLRIVGLHDDGLVSVQDLRKFMHHLLDLRERTHLDTVEIKFDVYNDDDDDDYDGDDVRYVNIWTRFAVMCKVRALTLHINDSYLALDDLPLVSRRLETLDLQGVALGKAFLDFASCPALKTLKMNDCEINAERISSSSLKHLSIICCRSDSDIRVRVSAPGLVSLELEGFIGLTPFLEGMALLEAACLNLGDQCQDVCLNYDTGVFCGANNNTCKYCFTINDDCCSDCVLLGGISNAKHLELISEIGTVWHLSFNSFVPNPFFLCCAIYVFIKLCITTNWGYLDHDLSFSVRMT